MPQSQYHFWRGADGVDAWEVDRLIDLAADLTPSEVAIEEIHEIDSVYWFDDQHPATVRAIVDHVRRIEAVDSTRPIILGPDGRVMDGMHRIARALLAGQTTISAVRFEQLPPPDRRGSA